MASNLLSEEGHLEVLILVSDCHNVLDVSERIADRDRIAEDNVDTNVDVDGERRNIKSGYLILERIGPTGHGVPSCLVNLITGLTITDQRKVEGTVYECVGVGKVDPRTNWDEMNTQGSILRSLGG